MCVSRVWSPGEKTGSSKRKERERLRPQAEDGGSLLSSRNHQITRVSQGTIHGNALYTRGVAKRLYVQGCYSAVPTPPRPSVNLLPYSKVG